MTKIASFKRKNKKRKVIKSTRYLHSFGHFLLSLFFHIVLFGIGLFCLLPFIWMVSTAFKPTPQILLMPPKWIPNPIILSNFSEAFNSAPFFRYFLNSSFQAIAVTMGVLFTSSLAGYGFVRFQFPGRNFIFTLFLMTMMIPGVVVLIPSYLLMDKLNWINTYYALIIPLLGSAFGTFLLRQFMYSIPTAILDAARIDGSSEFGIYCRIALPLCKPALAALAIFIFTFNWDSFLWPLLVLDDKIKFTLPLGLRSFQSIWQIYQYNLLMAGTIVATIPILLLFIILQKYFIRGISLTGLKA